MAAATTSTLLVTVAGPENDAASVERRRPVTPARSLFDGRTGSQREEALDAYVAFMPLSRVGKRVMSPTSPITVAATIGPTPNSSVSVVFGCCESQPPFGERRVEGGRARGTTIGVEALQFADQLEALDVYGTVSTFISACSDHDLLAATRCRGWTVTDLLFHLTCDAQRALVAFATPGIGAPDVDFATYWDPFQPSREEPDFDHVRRIRLAASTLSRRTSESCGPTPPPP